MTSTVDDLNLPDGITASPALLLMLGRAYYIELRAMEDNARLMEEYLK